MKMSLKRGAKLQHTTHMIGDALLHNCTYLCTCSSVASPASSLTSWLNASMAACCKCSSTSKSDHTWFCALVESQDSLMQS